MKVKNLTARRPSQSGFVLSSVFLASLISVAAIAAPAATPVPTVYLQNATVTASGNTVTVTRVPIQTSTGAIIYKDITTAYAVDKNGNLTIESGYPEIVASATLLNSNFKAGVYTAPYNNGTCTVTVGGPGVGAAGATAWSASLNWCPFNSATWYTGTLTANPEYARLTKAGITSTAYAYGILSGGGWNNNWSNGSLTGVAQTGNNLTFSSFSYNGNQDYSTPTNNFTVTLSP